jgi:hypothetical protein
MLLQEGTELTPVMDTVGVRGVSGPEMVAEDVPEGDQELQLVWSQKAYSLPSRRTTESPIPVAAEDPIVASTVEDEVNMHAASSLIDSISNSSEQGKAT